MRPRGYLGTLVMFVAITALPSGLLWSWMMAMAMRTSFSEIFYPIGLGGGVAFGVTFGAMMAFRFRAITVAVPVTGEHEAFLTRVTLRLAEIGYHPTQRVANAYTFQPSLSAGKAAGAITVAIENSEATIFGPQEYVRKVLELLATQPDSPPSVYRT